MKAEIEREAPGIPGGHAGLQYAIYPPGRCLAAALRGIRKQTLIVNLPGSPKAVRGMSEFILPQLRHGLEILLGETGDCARS